MFSVKRRENAHPARSFAAALLAAALLLGAAPAQAAPPAASVTHADAMIGSPTRVTATVDDSFVDLAQKYGVGYVNLMAANPGVNPWLPHAAGRKLVIPTQHLLPDAPHRGIVVNLGEMRLYWFPKDGPVQSFPIGIGRQGDTTPLGDTRIVAKREHPAWYPTAAIRREKPYLPKVVPAGPNNPLGDYAMSLGWEAYVIHGTNMPPGIGRRVSHGCIRMYPDSIKRLFSEVPVGTPVTVVDQPIKYGWHDGDLYIEVHPSGREIDEIENTGHIERPKSLDFWPGLKAAAGDQLDRVDAQAVFRAVKQRRGIPVRVTRTTSEVVASAPAADNNDAASKTTRP